ncbi:MAG TPA: RNA-binding protein [Candidatus Saccharimonadales bacterium]|nr:RNA-binding protein [Candidatus Saccharimonadales bacterium]
MASKLFIGSLPYSVTSEQLNEMFAAHGTVVSAVVIIDKFSNKSKGFGFVEMSTDDEAQAAMKALDGSEVEGRKIMVNEARPQEKRPPREGGFGGGHHDRGDYRSH